MGHRIGDITLVVCQDNDDKSLIIESIDESSQLLSKLVHYQPNDLIGKDLRTILPKRILKNINNYLEFENFGNDLASVLCKTRDFGLMSRFDKKVDLHMRIQHDISMDSNARYALVMRDPSKVGNGIIDELVGLTEYDNIDDITGSLEWDSFMKKLRLVSSYIASEKISASIAIISIDEISIKNTDCDKSTLDGLLKEVVLRCKQAHRDVDAIGYMGDKKFCIILLEANIINAQVPLNRLRWQIAHQPLFIPGNDNITATISIAYSEMKKSETVEEMIKVCDDMIDLHKDEGNRLLPVE